MRTAASILLAVIVAVLLIEWINGRRRARLAREIDDALLARPLRYYTNRNYHDLIEPGSALDREDFPA
jgi:hypothetical protein